MGYRDPWDDAPQRRDRFPYGVEPAAGTAHVWDERGGAGAAQTPETWDTGNPVTATWVPPRQAHPGWDNAGREESRWDNTGREDSRWDNPGRDESDWDAAGSPGRRWDVPAPTDRAGWTSTQPGGAGWNTGRPDGAGSSGAGWDAATGAIPRQRTPHRPVGYPTAEPSAIGRVAGRVDDTEPDMDDAEPGYLRTFAWTVAWYVVPTALYLLWSLTLSGTGCVGAVGAACQSPRAHMLSALVDHLPAMGVALAASLLFAAVIRRATGEWRAVSVGFAASVVGSGLATVVFSTLAGSSS